jgi:hypothetical protein
MVTGYQFFNSVSRPIGAALQLMDFIKPDDMG